MFKDSAGSWNLWPLKVLRYFTSGQDGDHIRKSNKTHLGRIFCGGTISDI